MGARERQKTGSKQNSVLVVWDMLTEMLRNVHTVKAKNFFQKHHCNSTTKILVITATVSNLWISWLRSKLVSSFSLFVVQQNNSVVRCHGKLGIVWWPGQGRYLRCPFLKSHRLLEWKKSQLFLVVNSDNWISFVVATETGHQKNRAINKTQFESKKGKREEKARTKERDQFTSRMISTNAQQWTWETKPMNAFFLFFLCSSGLRVQHITKNRNMHHRRIQPFLQEHATQQTTKSQVTSPGIWSCGRKLSKRKS